ncbi:cysteine proteinase, partial [Ceraceosorus guamensis]
MSGDNATLRWVPLESNPELFTEWSKSLGLDTSQYAFHDIYGLDAELLSMVPQPVQAVLLLFPISEAYEKKRREDDELVKEGESEKDGEIWFKQT